MGKIKVEICEDHFERMAAGDVCSTCPSKAENKSVVEAMSEVLQHDAERIQQAVINELKSIRRGQADIAKRIDSLEGRVIGNDTKMGIDNRLTVIETRLDAASKNTTANMAMVGVIVSTIIGLFSLLT